MIKAEDKSKCCGCTACMSVCPVHCIRMDMDAEGFYYPYVDDETCIHCRRCEKVCPYRADIQEERAVFRYAYGCQHPDPKVRMRSTSGGGFTLIAEEVIRCGGIVFGAGYDEQMHVIHMAAETFPELDKLRRSKYVQSDLRDTFIIIHDILKSGRMVLFTGTPCQVEGLVMSTPESDREQLLTADIRCYGVPSSGLFDRFQEYLRQYFHTDLKDFQFRDKKYGYSGVNQKAILRDGRVIEDRLVLKTYSKTMFSKVGLRRSCYECVFERRRKMSDFTFGDIWNIGDYSSDMDDEMGTTYLEVNSEKGRRMYDRICSKITPKSVEIESLTYEALILTLRGGMRRYPLDETRRTAFFDDMNRLSYSELMKKHFPDTLKNKIDNIMKPLVHKLPFSRRIFRYRKMKR